MADNVYTLDQDQGAMYLEPVDFSDLIEVETRYVDKDKDSKETFYQRVDPPDTVHQVRYRVGYYPNGKTGVDSIVNTSLKLTYWVCYDEGGANESWEEETVTIAHNGRRGIGANGLVWPTSNLISLLAGNIAAGALTYTGQQRLANGITRLGVEDNTQD